MAVSKDQVLGHTRVAGKVRDPVDHGLGDRELSEMATLDNETGNQTQKIVCALDIASGAKTNGRDTASLHTVTALLVIFVNLTIGSEHCTAMMCVVQATTEDDFTGAITGTAGGRREVIEPHHNKVHEMNHYLLGQVGTWECADDASRSLLDEADAAFNFTNMFRGSRRVEIDCQDVITDLVELIVHE